METNNFIQTSKSSESKREVLSALKNNLFGCDMLLSLFMATLQSSQVDKCLRPFPPMYLSNTQRDINRLQATCKCLPSLSDLLENEQSHSEEIFNLLKWLFCTGGHPELRLIDYNAVEVPKNIQKSFQPHYVFQVVYSQKTERLWQAQKLTNQNKTFLAYHGSFVRNFYSILRVGLQQNLSENKVLLYGAGIYLTTEIMVSMPYAPFGLSWAKSGFGNKHSIIALCEIIDSADKVKRRGRITNDSIFRNIPIEYFVVTDSNAVRIKYLFVYKENSKAKSWTFKLIILLISIYVVMLYCTGVFQGPTWNRLRKHFYNKILDIL